MSKLFWAVLDDEQKKRTEEILATFDKDSKDELGLMSITIALSNEMFPGTSVLHTRLRYIYLVVWIFVEVFTNKKWDIKTFHNYEHRLRRSLKAAGEANKKEYVGILGSITPNNQDLSQPPFSVYFNLLKEWGIILDDKVQLSDLYLELIDKKFIEIIEDEKFVIDSFKLSEIEKNEIFKSVPESILKTLFQKDIKIGKEPFIYFDIDENISEISSTQKELFKNAQKFSTLMWGSMIFYNYFLGNQSNEVRKAFENWKALIVDDKVLENWKPNDTLRIVNDKINNQTIHTIRVQFIESWYNYVIENIKNLSLDNPAGMKDKTLLKFLSDRESDLKGNRARLLKLEKGEFEDSAKYGLRPIEYRWQNIRRFIEDYKNDITD
ncbi:MAG: hypothetical protein DRG78_15990 [Epsilonproteobacteria bacterium]|nr:MAG: hypothetical protein DRG78_15990 [Campylobacterota bacterium]